MPNWETKPLGDLCRLVNGRAFKPSDWAKTGLPIVRIQNLNDENKPFNYYLGEYRDVHLIDDGEILLSWSGTPGTSFGCFRWNRGLAILNQHIFKVLPAEGIDADFFINAVNSKLDEMIAKAHGGVGLRHITKGKLESIRLPVPSLDEQRNVSQKIRDCFALIDEMKTLRLGTVRDSSLLLRSFYREQYCELLEKHESCSLSETGSVFGGGTPSKANKGFWIGEIPWISPKDMKVRDIYSAKDNISSDAIANSSTRLIENPSVLFVVRGMILSHSLPVSVSRVPVTINQDMKAITPSEYFDVDFLATVLRGAESELLSRIEIAGHGTCRLQSSQWGSIRIPKLTLDEQALVVARTKRIERATDALNSNIDIQDIAEFRRAVLKRFFIGAL
jgi:restriction endonuclease S subunit